MQRQEATLGAPIGILFNINIKRQYITQAARLRLDDTIKRLVVSSKFLSSAWHNGQQNWQRGAFAVSHLATAT